MTRFLSHWWGTDSASVEAASARDAARLAQIHAASFARGWGEVEFESMIAERNTLVQRLNLRGRTVGFAVSRIGADEAEVLSIAIDPPARGYRLSVTLLLAHLGHLAALGVRTSFLEVEENNQAARRLYDGCGFEVVGRRERYYKDPGGEQRNALLMRRDLS
ncbi:MAG: GNAT family N-acetyltransferase [Alphaproteobacteria bacterium]|nr:GNAT family N-acetyltransferase [Alphaproteobacteria bacterium]